MFSWWDDLNMHIKCIFEDTFAWSGPLIDRTMVLFSVWGIVSASCSFIKLHRYIRGPKVTYYEQGQYSKYMLFWRIGPMPCHLWKLKAHIILGPVVQSIVSLTSSLRVISLTVLVDSIYNILIFFAEKMWVAFALQKLLTFFQQKISAYLHITWCKF